MLTIFLLLIFLVQFIIHSILSSLLSIVFPFPVLSTFEQHQHRRDHGNTSKIITNPLLKENQLVLCAMSELHTVENKINQVVK